MGKMITEQEGNKNYLKCILEEQEEIDEDCLAAISEEQAADGSQGIGGIIPVIYSRVFTERILRYDVNAFLPLQEYKGYIATKDQISKLFLSIIDTCRQADAYLLDISYFMLEEEYIFVDKATGKAQLILYPVLSQKEHGDFRTLFFQIMQGIFLSKEDMDFYGAVMYELNQKDSFSVIKFRELLVSSQENIGKGNVIPSVVHNQQEDGSSSGLKNGRGWPPSDGVGNGGGWSPNGGAGNGGGWSPNGGTGNGGGWSPSDGAGNGGGWSPNGGTGNGGGWSPDGGAGNGGGWSPSGGTGNGGGWSPSGGTGNGGGWSPSGGTGNGGVQLPNDLDRIISPPGTGKKGGLFNFKKEKQPDEKGKTKQDKKEEKERKKEEEKERKRIEKQKKEQEKLKKKEDKNKKPTVSGNSPFLDLPDSEVSVGSFNQDIPPIQSNQKKDSSHKFTSPSKLPNQKLEKTEPATVVQPNWDEQKFNPPQSPNWNNAQFPPEQPVNWENQRYTPKQPPEKVFQNRSNFERVGFPMTDDEDVIDYGSTADDIEEEQPYMVLHYINENKYITANHFPFEIGREGSGYQIDPSKTKISRQHVEIILTPEGFKVCDCSKHGTSLNGVRIPKGSYVSLTNGSKLSLKEEEFVVTIYGR